MPLRSLASLDDATFDVSAAAVADGRLLLTGSVDEIDPTLGRVRLPVTLTVSDAIDVAVDSTQGTGELVLESIDVTTATVTLRGVIPCTVVVTTSARSRVLLDVGTTPLAVRRWGRWRTWDEGSAARVARRTTALRLRNTACPACTHPWDEHPGGADGARTTCGECEYELEHGELCPGRSMCAATVPNRLVDSGTENTERSRPSANGE